MSWAVALAVAAAALCYDPSAPASIAKRAALLSIGVVLLALALPAIIRAERRSVSAIHETGASSVANFRPITVRQR